MQAIEFETIINEPFIKVPHYEKLKGKEVRILVLHTDKHERNPQKPDFFDKIMHHPKHIENVRFLSREEAHER